MKKLKLFRGIRLKESEAEEIVEDILKNGLRVRASARWSGFVWKDLRSDLSSLIKKKGLTREDTSPDSEMVPTSNGTTTVYKNGVTGICFADRIGANYYAYRHNRSPEKNTSVVIEVDVDINSVAIDGRDFLYTVFGQLAVLNANKFKRQKDALAELFGDGIIKYLDKIQLDPSSHPFAVCDLATIDNEVIQSHRNNEILIKGRYNTEFKSAFFVKTPIDPTSIVNIDVNNEFIEHSARQITLKEVLRA